MESKIRLIAFGGLLFLLLLNSCSKKETIPAEIIPKDTMVAVMVDLYIADAILMNPNTSSKLGNVPSNALYNSILKKYHISKSRYDSSLAYYTEHIKMLNEIYENVVDILSEIQNTGYQDSLLIR